MQKFQARRRILAMGLAAGSLVWIVFALATSTALYRVLQGRLHCLSEQPL
jgi:hypothetical protein